MKKGEDDLFNLKRAIFVQILTFFIGVFLFIPAIEIHDHQHLGTLFSMLAMLLAPIMFIVNLAGFILALSESVKLRSFILLIHFGGILLSIVNLCVLPLSCRAIFFS